MTDSYDLGGSETTTLEPVGREGVTEFDSVHADRLVLCVSFHRQIRFIRIIQKNTPKGSIPPHIRFEDARFLYSPFWVPSYRLEYQKRKHEISNQGIHFIRFPLPMFHK